MANLFWKEKNNTRSLLATPFRSEEEFEKVIYETPEILEDIFLIKRQIRGGNKPGIPDIVGIDRVTPNSSPPAKGESPQGEGVLERRRDI